MKELKVFTADAFSPKFRQPQTGNY